MTHVAFKAFILRKKGVILAPLTLGEHLRNRRLRLDLRQEDVARQLGTLREVYERWERDERQPVVSEWPGILSFLGYYMSRSYREAARTSFLQMGWHSQCHYLAHEIPFQRK